MNLEVGDILLLKPNKSSLLGRIITALTMSPYSHTAIVYKVGFRTLLFEIGTKTSIQPLSNYDGSTYDIYRLRGGLTHEQKEEVTKWCLNHIGVKYDYIQLLNFADRLLLRVQFVLNMPNRFICSEAIDRMYMDALNIDLVSGRLEGDVSPADISKSPLLYKVGEHNGKESNQS